MITFNLVFLFLYKISEYSLKYIFILAKKPFRELHNDELDRSVVSLNASPRSLNSEFSNHEAHLEKLDVEQTDNTNVELQKKLAILDTLLSGDGEYFQNSILKNGILSDFA